MVEFAIVIIVLLLIFFMIIEVGRILWAWVTVQNAARQGARYAITGQFDPACLSDPIPCADPRIAGIEERVIDRMTGLRINMDAGRVYEDDFATFIEVYGINEFGELQPNFAGIPGQPMVVRVVYNVPIITPILNNIVTNVPVMGQVVRNNELFGQTGSVAQGQTILPVLPPVPTAGPSPTPTPSNTPTSTASATPGPSPTSTNTATPTVTNTPDRCNVLFEQELIQAATQIDITSDVGDFVTITDLTANRVLASNVLVDGPFDDHVCDGYVLVSSISPPLLAGHVLVVESTNGSFDVQTVQAGTSTPTPLPTQTTAPTPTPTATSTTTPTPTPIGPYLILNPTCTNTNLFQGTLQGFNWPNGTANYYWNGVILSTINIVSNQFQTNVSGANSQASNTITVVSGATSVSVIVSKPCPNVTPTPTLVATAEPTQPADLIIVGLPNIISTPPIVGYRPVQFSVEVRNDGDVDVSNAFFIDLFLDPTNVFSDRIPVEQTSGYTALSSLPAQTSRVITITSPLGFEGPSTAEREAYSMVDTIFNVSESNENNNIAGPLMVAVTPGNTPTPAPTLEGSGAINGIVWTNFTRWVPQGRAFVFLVEVEETSPGVFTKRKLSFTTSAVGSGGFTFANVPPATPPKYYEVVACFEVDGVTRVGTRAAAPGGGAPIYTNPSPTGCPYTP